MVERRKLIKNNALFRKARRYLVGGVDSPVRSFGYIGINPLIIRNGRGAKIYDYDGNEYIDYVLSWGAAILGHAYPQLVRELKSALSMGLGFGATNTFEIELAKVIRGAIPSIEKIRFVNSGTEAVMGALRLARGYTGRNKILKFRNSYHGHADYLLTEGGSGLATLQIPSSSGVPADFLKHTITAPLSDGEYLDKIFKKFGHDIAAVIVEPVGGNFGVVAPDAGFLRKLRQVTKEYGSLLIFDEVITGFRFRFGSLAQEFSITPDIICLGKIIGGGLPIGAYGARDEIMQHLAPLGKVYQASTFSGNPLVMSAGLITLRSLYKLNKDYPRLAELGKYLVSSLSEAAERYSVNLHTSHYASMFSLKFGNKDKFKAFYRLMLNQGVYLAPSEFEANFLSFAHTKRDIERTILAAKEAFKKIGV